MRFIIAICFVFASLPVSAKENSLSIPNMRLACQLSVDSEEDRVIHLDREQLAAVTFCDAYFYGISTVFCSYFESRDAIRRFLAVTANGKYDDQVFATVAREIIHETWPCPKKQGV